MEPRKLILKKKGTVCKLSAKEQTLIKGGQMGGDTVHTRPTRTRPQ